MADEKKKGFLDKAIDALTDRDEKAAAAAEAQKKLLAEQAKKEQVARDALKTKVDAEKAAAAKVAADAKAAVDKKAAEIAASAAAGKSAAESAAAKIAANQAAVAEKASILKTHTITPNETLSGLALHFYGHATPEYWNLIIQANKAELGEDVKNYKPGKTIKIPKLPDSMKK